MDVVLGCELMYYKTVTADLLSTVHHLLSHQGIFLHAHIFRSIGQDIELVEWMAARDWVTLRVPVSSFVSASQLSVHPTWFSVCCLVSGCVGVMASIHRDNPHWRLFVSAAEAMNQVQREEIEIVEEEEEAEKTKEKAREEEEEGEMFPLNIFN